MKPARILPVLLLSAAAALAASCASRPAPGVVRPIEPGEAFEFEGGAFQLRRVQEDYVLLRFREPSPDAGGISGFMDEVLRVSRYDLGEGRWYASEKLPGVYLQWLGLDSFALARDRDAVAEAVMPR